MHESTAYDDWVEESQKRRMFHGEKRGMVAVLTVVGNDRLGTIDPATALALEAINDLDRLDRMALALSTATSWKDVLATP